MSDDTEEEFQGKLLHQAALWDNAELLGDLLNGDQVRAHSSKVCSFVFYPEILVLILTQYNKSTQDTDTATVL